MCFPVSRATSFVCLSSAQKSARENLRSQSPVQRWSAQMLASTQCGSAQSQQEFDGRALASPIWCEESEHQPRGTSSFDDSSAWTEPKRLLKSCVSIARSVMAVTPLPGG